MNRASNRELRPLLEGALLAAISVVLVLVGMFLPVIGQLLVLVWPVPFAIAAFRHGLRLGVMTVIVAGFVSGLFTGILSAMAMAVIAGSTGIAFGLSFRRQLSGTMTMIVGSSVLLVALAVVLGLTFLFIQTNPLVLYRQLLVESLELSQNLYDRLGAGEQIRPMVEQFREVVDLLFGRLLPATLAIAVVTQAWVNYAVMKAVFERLGHTVPDIVPFARWQLPHHTIWLYVAGYSASWLGQFRGLPWLDTVGQNVLMVLMFAFVIQGISFSYFFLQRWNVAKWASILILAAAAFNQLLTAVLFFAGMFETVLQYRTTVLERDRQKGPKPPQPER